MTKGLLISRLTKIKLCKLSVLNPHEPNISNFKRFRNMYATTLRTSKKLYYQKILFTYQADAKKTWEILRKAINNTSKKTNSIQKIVSNGITLDDPGSIANNFNIFFTNVADDIVKSIHPPNPPFSEQPRLNGPVLKFSDNPLTEVEVKETTSQLKNKTSQDSNGLSTNFVKKIINELAPPLTILFKQSLETGTAIRIQKGPLNYTPTDTIYEQDIYFIGQKRAFNSNIL